MIDKNKFSDFINELYYTNGHVEQLLKHLDEINKRIELVYDSYPQLNRIVYNLTILFSNLDKREKDLKEVRKITETDIKMLQTKISTLNRIAKANEENLKNMVNHYIRSKENYFYETIKEFILVIFGTVLGVVLCFYIRAW